jgi:hypothetical protein
MKVFFLFLVDWADFLEIWLFSVCLVEISGYLYELARKEIDSVD